MKNALPLHGQHLFQVGEFQLDLGEGILLNENGPVPITPKMFEVLWLLVRNRGRIVGKDELLSGVWADCIVEEANIAVTIGQLRKALGDNAHSPTYIQTVARRGYRFVAPVHEVEEDPGVETGDRRPETGRQENGSPANVNESQSMPSGLNHHETSRPRENSRSYFKAGISAIVLLLAIGVAGYYMSENRARPMSSRFDDLRVERLTDNGFTAGQSISPDGKLFAYSTLENGKSVIWLRQLATGKTLQVAPPADDMLTGIAFSPDGEYLFYFHSNNTAFSDVSRISIFGGTPSKILSNVHGGISFSPDGGSIAFTRFHNHQSSIVIADSDGRNERLIFAPLKGETVVTLDWMPDGGSIAFAAGKFTSDERYQEVRRYDLATAAVQSLSQFKWNQVSGIECLPDSSGILVSGNDVSENAEQVWLITVPDGSVRQLTSNSSSLALRGATADFSKILAREKTLKSELWISDMSDSVSAMDFVSSAQFDLAFAPDGSIVYSSGDSSAIDIWINNGTQRRQLTASLLTEQNPAVSPDGKTIAYVADENGRRHIWRMNIDGSEPVKLTDSTGEHYPTFTPDGRFIVFNSTVNGSVMKVPVEGGEPVTITNERALRVAVSPEGQRFASIESKDNVRTLIVRDMTTGTVVKTIPVPGRNTLASRVVWENGTSLLIAATHEGRIANLFRIRFDGSAPEQLTAFTSEIIFDFGLSPDRKRIAIVRGGWKNDTILLSSAE